LALLAAAIAVDKAFIQQQGIALALAGDVHGKLLDQRAVAVAEHAPGAGVAVKKTVQIQLWRLLAYCSTCGVLQALVSSRANRAAGGVARSWLGFLQQELRHADAVLVKTGLAIAQVQPPQADEGFVKALLAHGVELCSNA
jgi:methyl coenzyme M reductase beta subunit